MKITGMTLYRTTAEGRVFHAHEQYQLHFVVSGVGAYELAGHSPIDVRPGTFFVIPPRLDHRISLPGNVPLLEYLVAMEADGGDDPVKKLLDNQLGNLRAFAGIPMNLLFFEVKREQLSGGNPYERRAAEHGLFSWLYGLCARHFAANFVAAVERPDVVESALEILQNNIEKEMNLEMLARRLGINRFSLTRKFSCQLGVSPMKYFVRLKLESAAVMLRESGLTVGKIAERLRFSDQFHFSKRFKTAYGTSPARYREQTGMGAQGKRGE